LTREAGAQISVADEAAIKAAYVYNFLKFVEWPADVWNKIDNVRLCLVGPFNELAGTLTDLADKKPQVQGKVLEVRLFRAPEDAAACQVLVLTARDHIEHEWLRTVATAPILTVGDSPGFAVAGGTIGFYLEKDKVRFEVNVQAARRGNLKLASQLLKLARLVSPGAAGSKP
jgi:hypothetical protein